MGCCTPKPTPKGQTIQYLRDTYGRVTQVQHSNPNDAYGNPVPPTVMRTYIYDTNPTTSGDDPNYSQHAWARLTRIQYNVPAIASPALDNNSNEVDFTGDTVNEMYSYDGAGHVVGKRMRITRNATRGNSPTADLNASWTYDKESRLTSVTYPCDSNAFGTCPPAPINYSYDGMGRLAGAQYNAAGQMTQWGTETRQYNSMGQLTNITVPGQMNITYTYPQPGQNSGKIVSDTDNLTGETVTYAYDSLNRLISAQAGSSWGQGFQYDGFGNLTAKTDLAGSVPTFSAAAEAATDHLTGSFSHPHTNPPTPSPHSTSFA